MAETTISEDAFESSRITLSIVMPCLNEAETLAICIEKAHAGLNAAGISLHNSEIIIADNGSTDGSQAIAQRLGAQVIQVRRAGYGAALSAGFAAARGRYVIMADSDDSYDLTTLKPFIEPLQAGGQFICGTRFKGEIKPGAMPPLSRWFGNPSLTALGNVLFGTHLSDYHCGMRGFERQAVLDLDLQTPGMEFATEMIAKAAIHHLKISEVPIVYGPAGRSRAPHLRPWPDGWRHLRFMLLISPAWVFLYPGLMLTLFGLAGMLVLLPGPLAIGSLHLDVHTLLVCGMAVVIGVEVLTFWLCARLFAHHINVMPLPKALLTIARQSPLAKGLVLSSLLITLGIVPVVQAVGSWTAVQFGELDYRTVLRLLIPGLVLIAVGTHMFFASFIISLLNFSERWTLSMEEFPVNNDLTDYSVPEQQKTVDQAVGEELLA
jgi:glycosyltransferase involved in cell wall biosynthesis